MRIVIFILILGLLAACKEPLSHSTQVFLLVDTSEKDSLTMIDLVLRDTTKIVDLVANENAGLYSYGKVSIATINDLDDNRSETVQLNKPKHGIFPENKYVTIDNIANFRKSLATAVKKQLYEKAWGTEQSMIYANLCATLSKIQKESSYDKSYLIVYTDLLENSSVLQFYNKIEPYTLELERKIAKQAGLGLPNDLTGIEIKFVSKRDTNNNARITQAQAFWKQLLEHHKAKVAFGVEF